MPTEVSRALSFDAVAAEYATARPDYPAALFAGLEEFTARPLTATRVLDAGAGTGIATRLLRQHGAEVTALERGPGMAERFRIEEPAVPVVQADGNSLPFTGGCFDLVTYAQAFHWTAPQRSVPEAFRVLRPDGALALWWNTLDLRVPWMVAQDERLGVRGPGAFVTERKARELLAPFGLTVQVRTFPWSRRVPIDVHLRNLGSHSHFATAADGGREALRRERDVLQGLFPDGTVTESYRCVLVVAHRAAVGS